MNAGVSETRSRRSVGIVMRLHELRPATTGLQISWLPPIPETTCGRCIGQCWAQTADPILAAEQRTRESPQPAHHEILIHSGVRATRNTRYTAARATA